jgi:hypothetical protein
MSWKSFWQAFWRGFGNIHIDPKPNIGHEIIKNQKPLWESTTQYKPGNPLAAVTDSNWKPTTCCRECGSEALSYEKRSVDVGFKGLEESIDVFGCWCGGCGNVQFDKEAVEQIEAVTLKLQVKYAKGSST